MPSMANLTVKKADGTTDVVYVAQVASAGDNSPASWRVDAIGSVRGNRPILTISSKPTANRAARVVSGKLVYPETYTDSTTGIVEIRSSVSCSFTVIVPQLLTDTTITEACAQFGNLLDSALIQSCFTSGFAPT